MFQQKDLVVVDMNKSRCVQGVQFFDPYYKITSQKRYMANMSQDKYNPTELNIKNLNLVIIIMVIVGNRLKCMGLPCI